MRIAVTDANIFIDLVSLQIHTHFFELGLDVHTTRDVYNQLCSEHQTTFDTYQSSNKFTVHILTSADCGLIRTVSFSNGLAFEEKTVFFLAKRLDAHLLCTDKHSWSCAESKSVGCYGIIWVLDKLLEENRLTNKEALAKLNELIDNNPIYRTNTGLLTEIGKRAKIWTI